MKSLLQIVPRYPGELDGVGDYARNLAGTIEKLGRFSSTFTAPRGTPSAPSSVTLVEAAEQRFDAILLHYVNYGYARNGVPDWLPATLQNLSRQSGRAPVVIFHELYARGLPWQRDFWTSSKQKRVVKDLAGVARASIVSNDVSFAQLRQLTPSAEVYRQPIPSNFGEPSISPEQIAQRDPGRWAISGGQYLIQRSLESFCSSLAQAGSSTTPRQLLVIGGKRDAQIERKLKELSDRQAFYFPEVSAGEASELLLTVSYGWIDYFTTKVSASAIVKSSSFANLCSHAVVPVLASGTPPVEFAGDNLPVKISDLEMNGDRIGQARDIYCWYQRVAAVEHLARKVIELLDGGER